ncbi:MAG: hypothetical protein K9M15_00650 [Candidatus Marinimicrobia bacterium]|nr:hypothetical protein [Candidatus Neomarinimicrobiota bacterium]
MLNSIQYNLAKYFGFPFDPYKDQKVLNMLSEIDRHGGALSFDIHLNQEGWTAECKSIPGIITCGQSLNPEMSEIDSAVKDAIFSAFDIPPYLCKENLIKNTKEPATKLIYAGK